ncbi:MAG: gliding motility-associated C-terminal domain-containing protein [Flavobacteriales bacterium]|nr:gliding motility-associated C-terminal domain-containing protein [Flavobacteriales bacterium]
MDVRRISAVMAGLAMGAGLLAQPCSLQLGPDTVLCDGGTLVLQVPLGALSFTWNTGSTASQITVSSTGDYWCEAVFPQNNANQIQNGDFTQGATAFSSDYVPGTGGTYGLLSTEGQYATATDPGLTHNMFNSFGDHTTGTGNMLVVNGASVPGQNIWCQTVNVQPGTSYAFSAWLASVVVSSPAQLVFSVNGQIIGAPLLASATVGQWLPFYSLWNSGVNTSATLCIVNQNTATSGNDFALDDITFNALCAASDTVHVEVLPPAPSVSITGSGLCPGSTAVLAAMLDPAGWPLNDVVYVWDTQATGPELVITAPGTYSVSATGQCLSAQEQIVVGLDTCGATVQMPNVFSPNGDGLNDTFGPIVDGVPDAFTMDIRNRWGQLVFQGDNISERWNGRWKGSSVPDGTYYYVIQYAVRQNDGSLAQRNEAGYLTLLGQAQ